MTLIRPSEIKAWREGRLHIHHRTRSKSVPTHTTTTVTILERCRCGAHRNVTIAEGRVERTEWK